MDTTSNKERLRVSDLIVGSALCIITTKIFVTSLGFIVQTMRTGAPYYQSAGFFPAVVSSILFICACSLVRTALKSIFKNKTESVSTGNLKYLGLIVSENLRAMKKGAFGFLLVLSWFGFYVFVLLGRLSYVSATFIFVFVFMALFHFKEESRISVRQAATLLLTAFLMALFISLLFQNVARIPLP